MFLLIRAWAILSILLAPLCQYKSMTPLQNTETKHYIRKSTCSHSSSFRLVSNLSVSHVFFSVDQVVGASLDIYPDLYQEDWSRMSLMGEKMGFENSFAYSEPTEFQLTTSGQSCKPTFLIFINAVHHQKVTESWLGGWSLNGLLWWFSSKESSCSAGDVRDTSSTPGSGRSPGEGNGKPLHYACLEESMDRGAWRATAHRVAQSQIQLST